MSASVLEGARERGRLDLEVASGIEVGRAAAWVGCAVALAVLEQDSGSRPALEVGPAASASS